MIIGLFGLSGSGKTHLSNEFKNRHEDFFCTSASNILRASQRPISLEHLDKTTLDINQLVFQEELSKLKKTHTNLLIELHAVIENKSGGYYKVPKNILNSLCLDLSVFLDIPIDQILKQRNKDTTKHRAYKNIEQLTYLSCIQKEYLNEVFPNNAVKMIKEASDIEKLLSLLN